MGDDFPPARDRQNGTEDLFYFYSTFTNAARKVRWKLRLCTPARTFNTILDATECPIERPADYETQKNYYSGKKKKHTLKYEVVVSIVTGFFVRVTGGFPGSMHDFTMSILSGLFEDLLPGELVLADKGYIGDESIVTPVRRPATDDEWETNRALSSVRELVEHSIGRLKVFKCLTTPWRHDLTLHPIVFMLICNIMNLEFTFHPPRQ